ncbi:hypothetical protein B0H13DRAFT_2674660 [Mycena leptocephala]|nr:hypothetical protein B0H13DRAFT_2674660 [Mycena leptocephala]
MTVDFVLMLRFPYSSSNAIVELTANYSNLQSLDLIWKAEMDDVPRFLTLYAAAPLIVTFIMFVMTLYKCALTMHRMDRRVMPVWRLFLRDGVVWFVLVFAAGGSELLIWTMRRETLKQILVVWVSRLLPSSNSSHAVFLNSLQPRSCNLGRVRLKGVIAVVHGHVLGLGVDIFSIKEVDMAYVPKIVGHHSLLRELAFSAADAERMGLLSRVVPGGRAEVRWCRRHWVIAGKSTKRILLHSRRSLTSEPATDARTNPSGPGCGGARNATYGVRQKGRRHRSAFCKAQPGRCWR